MPMQKISRCNHCGQYFGTKQALEIHQPGKCRSDKTMQRGGAWRGFMGIWWTPDLGWDQESEEVALEAA